MTLHRQRFKKKEKQQVQVSKRRKSVRAVYRDEFGDTIKPKSWEWNDWMVKECVEHVIQAKCY